MSSVYCLQVGSKQLYRYCPVKDELFLSELPGPTEFNRKNVRLELSEYERVDLANAKQKFYEAISRENRRDGEPPNIKMNIPSLCWAFIVKILHGISDSGITKALRRASANGNFTDIFALICKVLRDQPQPIFPREFEGKIVRCTEDGSLVSIRDAQSRLLVHLQPSIQPTIQERSSTGLLIQIRPSTANTRDDIPNLKRRCEKLREETEELEEEYEKRRLQAQSNLLKTIKEYEQKKAACKAKIEELNKLVGE